MARKLFIAITKRWVILLVMVLAVSAGNGQPSNADKVSALIARLSACKEDTAKVRLLVEILQAHMSYSTEKGLTYRKQALDLAEKLRWKLGIAMVMEASGRLYWGQSDGPAAVKDHQVALALYQQLGDKKAESRVSRYLGQDYMDNAIYPEAKVHLDHALKTAELIGDKKLMAAAYNIISAFYNAQANSVEAAAASYKYLKIIEETNDTSHLVMALLTVGENLNASGNVKEARGYFTKGLEIAIRENISSELQMAYMSLGDFYVTTGEWQGAIDSYTKTRQLTEVSGTQSNVAYVYSLIGNVYKQMGNYPKALEQYLLSIKNSDHRNYSQRVLNVYMQIGAVYTMLGQYDSARAAFRKVGNPYQSPNSAIFRMDYFRGLQMLDSATGNWADAYKHYKTYLALRDSSFNKETLKTLVASQTQYEADKKEADIRAAQEKKDLLSQEEAKRQRNIRNAAFIGLAAVLLFSALIFKQRNKIAREKKRSDQLVHDKELLLREIHHRVKNNLEVVSSLLALQSAQIGDEGTRDAMQESQNRVQSIGIVHQKLYQGTNLGAVEMKDYFIDLSESILDSFGAESRITIECAMEKLDVDIDTAVPLGLIVNELLTNTLKYAYPEGQKGHVIIKLEKKTAGILHLEVSDDGVGKSGIIKGTGFGGQLVALLTQQLDGTMREVSENGTRIFFEFKDTVRRVA